MKIALLLLALSLTGCAYKVQSYEIAQAIMACDEHAGVRWVGAGNLYVDARCNDGTYIDNVRSMK